MSDSSLHNHFVYCSVIQGTLAILIDGTLLGKSKKLSKPVKEALRRTQQKGNKIFLCTGRAPVSLDKELLEFGFDGIVASAGSYVIVDDQCIFEHSLDQHTLLKVSSLFIQKDVMFTYETKDALYSMPGYDRFFSRLDEDRYGDNFELRRTAEARRNAQTRLPISDYKLDTPVYKMTFVANCKYDILDCIKYLHEDFNMVFFSSLDKDYLNGEIISKECTKATGIEKVLEYFGGNMEDAIGFGDSMNDYQMLECCGKSAVFENAEQKLLDLADYTFPDPDELGVSVVVNSY